MKISVSEVYQRFIWGGDEKDLAKDLYDTPAISMGAVSGKAPALLKAYTETNWHTEERTQLVIKALISANQEIGCLTNRVREVINNLENGAVEAAHQPISLGGPTYILNKAATALSLATFSMKQDHPLVPFFFIADYDIVQSELTNIRSPNMGQEGNLVSLPIPDGYEHSPVSVLPLPSHDWYLNVEENLRAS
ncbi:MAG: bacillithiol biosynthesis BshC, partial [Candidatus Hodarchaeota archaeon]